MDLFGMRVIVSPMVPEKVRTEYYRVIREPQVLITAHLIR